MDNNEFFDRVPLAKMRSVDGGFMTTNVMPPEQRVEDSKIFEKTGALVPPYAGTTLCKIYEHSNSLRPNVDAYVVNIDGHGHRFEPIIDFDADESFDVIRDTIFLDRVYEARENDDDVDLIEQATDSEVEEYIEKLKFEMRLEKSKLENFFRFCCLDESFISLRKKTRNDLEIMGNAYWEVLRDSSGEISQFNYAQATSMRLLPLDKELTKLCVKAKRTKISYEEKEIFRRFRKFVQIHEGQTVYFKEFGDPRVISALTGEVYDTVAKLQSSEKEMVKEANVPVATEIIHFSIHSPNSPYGVPRWIGSLLSVLGSRQSEEVNLFYFNNKSVPPLAVLVSGGRLSADSTKRLEDYIRAKIQGRNNFHKILIIEGIPADKSSLESPMGANSMKIEIKPLTDAQNKDALFQNYDERNIDKVGMTFRLPRLLRGDIRDFNRATAESAIEFTESQVFSPERGDFDWMINRKIFSDLGIRYWNFVSNSPTTSNPMDLTSIIVDIVKAGIITPEEARELTQGIFNKDFKKIEEIWAKVPLEILKLGIGTSEVGENENDNTDEINKGYVRNVVSGSRDEMIGLAKDILRLRGYIDEVELDESKMRFDEIKKEDLGDPEIIEVPRDELIQFFENE